MILTHHYGSARLVLRPRLPQEPDRPLHIADGDGQGQRGRGGHEDPYENRRQRGHPQEVEGDEKVRTNCHQSTNSQSRIARPSLQGTKDSSPVRVLNRKSISGTKYLKSLCLRD